MVFLNYLNPYKDFVFIFISTINWSLRSHQRCIRTRFFSFATSPFFISHSFCNAMNKSRSDLIWSLNGTFNFFSQIIYLVFFQYLCINNIVKLKRIQFYWQFDEFVIIPLHYQIIVWIHQNFECCGNIAIGQPLLEIFKKWIMFLVHFIFMDFASASICYFPFNIFLQLMPRVRSKRWTQKLPNLTSICFPIKIDKIFLKFKINYPMTYITRIKTQCKLVYIQ